MVYGNNSYATEDYLEGCTPIHVIPSYATIDEMAYYVIESAEQDFNNIMMETGIEELQYFERTGEELVTEAKSFIDTAQDWLEKTWRKCQDMIQKATDSFSKKAEDFRGNIIKKVDKKFIEDKLKNVPAKRDFGSSYDFKGLSEYTKYLGNLQDLQKAVWKDYDTALASHKSENASASDSSNLETAIENDIKSCVNKMTGSNETSTSSVVKSLKENLRGSTKDWKGSDVTSNWSDIYNEVLEFPKTKRELKNSYNLLKRQFNDDIRKVKSARDSKGSDTIFAKAIKGIKSSKSLAVAVEQALISVLNERYSQYRTILLRLVATKKVRESATVSTSDTVESLFNW